MLVRDATAADLPTIVALLADDDLGRRRESTAHPLDDAYTAAFEAITRDPENHLVVGEDAGEVVGTLQLTFIPHLTFRGGWRAQIEAVRIAADHRDRGLGRHLFTWAIDRSRARGCHLVQLTTNAARGDARRFYEELGFLPSHTGMKLYLSGSVDGR